MVQTLNAVFYYETNVCEQIGNKNAFQEDAHRTLRTVSCSICRGDMCGLPSMPQPPHMHPCHTCPCHACLLPCMPQCMPLTHAPMRAPPATHPPPHMPANQACPPATPPCHACPLPHMPTHRACPHHARNPCHACPPPVDRQTDTCKNITFANFVCGWYIANITLLFTKPMDSARPAGQEQPRWGGPRTSA